MIHVKEASLELSTLTPEMDLMVRDKNLTRIMEAAA